MGFTVYGVRYEPNNSYADGLGAHMMSDDTEDVAMKGARDVVFAALLIAPTSSASEKGQSDGTRYRDHFEVVPDIDTIDGNPRRSAVVINDSDYAAQVEFGIGPGWKGERVQGGHHGSPSRVLGRAGARVGDYQGGPPA